MKRIILLFVLLTSLSFAQSAEPVVRTEVDGLIDAAKFPTFSGVMGWSIPDPAVAATSQDMYGLPYLNAGTIKHLVCACQPATCTVSLNLDARSVTTLATPGTDLHTSEIVADFDGVTVTTFAGDDTNAANEVWNLSISAITNAPTILRCFVTLDKN